MQFKQQKEELRKSLAEKIHGKMSKPRAMQPSMFDILNWNDQEKEESVKETKKVVFQEEVEEVNKENEQVNESGLTVFVEKDGKLEPIKLEFKDKEELESFLMERKSKTKTEMAESEVVQLEPQLIEQKPVQKKKKKRKKRPSSVRQPDADQDKRIKKFTEQSRWLPNTAFQTFWGKPAFENYGMGNTNPVWGGLGYGNYLKSYNINPQRGNNKPKYEQVFKSAKYASYKVNYDRSHIPRKIKDEYVLAEEEVEEQKKQLQLFPVEEAESLGELSKPDLKSTMMFKSRVQVGKKKMSDKERDMKIKEELQHMAEKQKEVEHNLAVASQMRRSSFYEKNKAKRLSESMNLNKQKNDNSKTLLKKKFVKYVAEYNPRNYVGINPINMNSIPYAGKRSRFTSD